MRDQLHEINAAAHLRTIHPNGLRWPDRISDEERDFISRVAFDQPGQYDKAAVYLVKELAQLAEIERHVSAVMTYVLSELQGESDPLSEGYELHEALSCFAAEELHHANMFYRYVRLIAGRDFKYPDNLFAERVALYQGDDSPYVKLAALCCSAYIGESVITVFERRTQAYDPEMRYFLTQLLYAHGLDEARHIKTDHFVFDHVIPSLGEKEKRRMRQILDGTEALNTELAMRFGAFAKESFGIDYTAQNISHQIQMQLTMKFRTLVFGGNAIRKVDDAMDAADRELVQGFSRSAVIHG